MLILACAVGVLAQGALAVVDDVAQTASFLREGGPWAIAAICLFAVYLLYRDASRNAKRLEAERTELQSRLLAVIESQGAVLAQVRDELRACHGAALHCPLVGRDADGIGSAMATPSPAELGRVRAALERLHPARAEG